MSNLHVIHEPIDEPPSDIDGPHHGRAPMRFLWLNITVNAAYGPSNSDLVTDQEGQSSTEGAWVNEVIKQTWISAIQNADFGRAVQQNIYQGYRRTWIHIPGIKFTSIQQRTPILVHARRVLTTSGEEYPIEGKNLPVRPIWDKFSAEIRAIEADKEITKSSLLRPVPSRGSVENSPERIRLSSIYCSYLFFRDLNLSPLFRVKKRGGSQFTYCPLHIKNTEANLVLGFQVDRLALKNTNLELRNPRPWPGWPEVSLSAWCLRNIYDNDQLYVHLGLQYFNFETGFQPHAGSFKLLRLAKIRRFDFFNHPSSDTYTHNHTGIDTKGCWDLMDNRNRVSAQQILLGLVPGSENFPLAKFETRKVGLSRSSGYEQDGEVYSIVSLAAGFVVDIVKTASVVPLIECHSQGWGHENQDREGEEHVDAGLGRV
ncbi:hypothetical protein BDN72DRAFT_854524 [Pluteus cervinus]|uniref:Uncharacterized protein n=1 Tax=Pluteus cervinus TaxID=181527 RepID=A0ACD3B6S8_9AGAR|nr:hypothetical protein BDN72DRAFT_854524 [Pluteus cervinus]